MTIAVDLGRKATKQTTKHGRDVLFLVATTHVLEKSTWMKVFRTIPEFKIKMLNLADYIRFSNLLSI